MRLGHKTKKALRIGAKVGAVAGAVALGTKGRGTQTAQERPDFNKTLGQARAQGKVSDVPLYASSTHSSRRLASSTGQLKTQSQDLAGMATKLRMREEAKTMGNPIGRFFG
tara:strand:- start:120 stop:452 length:333 start_codon:yes stop_codon:yes gene_type:complete